MTCLASRLIPRFNKVTVWQLFGAHLYARWVQIAEIENRMGFSGRWVLSVSLNPSNHFCKRRNNHGSKIRWRHQEYRSRSWRFFFQLLLGRGVPNTLAGRLQRKRLLEYNDI